LMVIIIIDKLIIDKTLLCDAESIDGARLYVNRKRLNISLGRFLISRPAPFTYSTYHGDACDRRGRWFREQLKKSVTSCPVSSGLWADD
jgi:hypothetical protein